MTITTQATSRILLAGDEPPAVGITVDGSVVRVEDEVHLTALVASEHI